MNFKPFFYFTAILTKSTSSKKNGTYLYSKIFYKRLMQSLSFLACFRTLKYLKLKKNDLIYFVRNDRIKIYNNKESTCNTSLELENVFIALKNEKIKIVKIEDPLSHNFKNNFFEQSIYRSLIMIFLNLPINIIFLIFFPLFLKSFYGFLFSKINPKYIFAIMPDLILCSQSRKRNIKIFDVQHGGIETNHIWYLLRTKNKGDKKFVLNSPTNYFVWNNETKNILNNMGVDKKNIVVVNIPKLKIENQESFKALKSKTNQFSNTLLITLQWNKWYGENLLELLPLNFISAIQRLKDTLIIFKFHPMIYAYEKKRQISSIENIKKNLDPTSSIIYETNVSLHESIKLCNLHITINSSTALIANEYKKNTLIIDPFITKELTDSFKQYKYIHIKSKSSSSEFINSINLLKSSTMKVVEYNNSMSSNIVRFFKKNL